MRASTSVHHVASRSATGRLSSASRILASSTPQSPVFVPDRFVQRLARIPERVLAHGLVDSDHGCGGRDRIQRSPGPRRSRSAIRAAPSPGSIQARSKHEPGRVPELLVKLRALSSFSPAKPRVVAGSRSVDQSEAQCICADLLDGRERIDGVALGLRHLLPVRVADQAGQIDRVEGRFAGEMDAQHHHPGHPEEDDVVGRLHDRARIEAIEIVRLLGPAERGEGPQPRTEPRVEYVIVLAKFRRRAPANLAGGRTGGVAVTVVCPSGQYQAGIRWPHHSWRLTFQSRISVIQCSQTLTKRSGRIWVLPDLVASRAAAARGATRMNHCVLRRGSTTSSERWQRPKSIS